MKTKRKNAFDRLVLTVACLLFPVFVNAQSSIQQDYVFSYVIIEAESEATDLAAVLQSEVLPQATRNGGIIYSTWTAAAKPATAPFAGLDEDQLGLMLAWQVDAREQIAEFDASLAALEQVTLISNRLFDAIYLPFGLSLPTAEGFYVHREEKYSLENEGDAIRLSQEAWVTWEPRWEVTVVGLFRQRGTGDFANLNRIVWYPSYARWFETRSNDDTASSSRFRERRGLQLPGSGVAIATDRSLP